ncbi:FAD-dependent oxidoreductase [Aeromicrobium sp.]|uniref:FAD-dependent oxidoreductase n=1 Tax=Aeromicrobium sp. TaxID=1871063 RepID=UPI001987AA75|nr:FAD-dependent oxidoreductase [Aeromicrobium sp.]MBC7630110.1 FAD-dependent oxidoreductase [Aeromicrobium sp.]
MNGLPSVVIVGGGGMGSSVARDLAERGHRVTVLEQHTAGHQNGSSHGSSRIVRLVYDDPSYVRLAHQARPLWDDLQLLSDEPVFRRCGSVDHGPANLLEPFAAALDACGVDHEWLTPAAASGRWPGLRFDEAVLHQPDGGVAHADNTLTVLRRLAREAGAVWQEHTRVDSIIEDCDGVTVRAGSQSFSADQVVITTGVWAHQLVDLPPGAATQVQPAHFAPLDPAMTWPTFIHRRAVPAGHAIPESYGLPSPDGIKVGFHGGGKVVDPDHRDFAVVESEVELLRAYVETWVPGVDPSSIRPTTCLYGGLAEDDFIIDRVGRVTVAAGFSGHGFKFVPLVGRMVAELVTGVAEPEPRFTLTAHRARSKV